MGAPKAFESNRSPEPQSGLPATPRSLYAIFGTLIVGLGVALYLVQHKLRIRFDPAYKSSCNVSDTINCDAVNVSDASELFGLPISLLAVPTYAVLAYFAWQALKALRETDPTERQRGGLALAAGAAVALSTVAYSVYLFWYSGSVVGSYCLYCMSLYAVNAVLAGLFLWAGPRHPGRAISQVLKGLADLRQPLVSAVGVLIITGGAAWVGYDISEETFESDALAIIAVQQADLEASMAEPVAVSPADRAAEAAAAAIPVPASKQGVRNLPDPNRSVRKGTKTDDGWPYFFTPLDDANEFFAGNRDAKVTVVKYADFQCGYCKYLKSSMTPLKKKYGDKVRFVMKHFPMNVKCNRRMGGYDKHPYACEASYAAHCAGEQGKFWEMHDVLYENQSDIEPQQMRAWAQKMGLDLAAFDACLVSPETAAVIQSDIEIAYKADIYGTPRTYINNRLVTGSASTSILDYHIQRALKEVEAGAPPGEAPKTAPVVMAPKSDGRSMIAGKKASGTFYIDAYESALTAGGKAVSMPGVEPARVSWFEASAACKAAGKRLCTEEEWVSVCSGEPAVDDNNNRYFGDDAVEGNMYPYGPFYTAGACNDQGDKYEGRAVRTGSNAKCRTPGGVFDLAGNIGEWVGASDDQAASMGGHSATGERAACNQRSASGGAGRKNHTTGFRCCADTNIPTASLPDPDDLKPHPAVEAGQAVPAFTATDIDGKTVSTKNLKGKILLINFFASWCGPCKKELPYLVNYDRKYRKDDLVIIGIGVDNQAQRSIDFVKGFDATYSVITDSESRLMGEFGVFSMPATFIVDRAGVIRYKDTGFKPEEQAAPLQRAIEQLLGKGSVQK